MVVKQSNRKPYENSRLLTKDSKSGERRRYARSPFSASALIVGEKLQLRGHGRVSDIGIGGCYVDMLSPFPVGSEVHLELTHEDKTFKAEAVVVYALTGLGMGLGFTQLNPEDLEILRGWLGGLG